MRISAAFLFLAIFTTLNSAWAAEPWKPKWTKPHPGWKTYRTQNFDFYYAPDSRLTRPGLIEIFAQRREQGRVVICEYLEITEHRRIKVFIYDNNEVAQKTIGRNAGFSECTVAIIHTRVNQTIGHELTHVLSRAINGRPPPNRVLDEGLAVFLDLTRRDYFVTAQKSLREDKLPTINQMLEHAKTGREDWYPAAGSFVGFLCKRYGIKKFKELWGSKERTFDLALRKVYAKSSRRIESEWREYLRSYQPRKNIPSKPVLPAKDVASKTASFPGPPVVPQAAKVEPKASDIVFYDDCGNPKAQPHRKKGYNDTLGRPHPENKPAENTLVASGKEIIFYYEGLDPNQPYYVRVTYVQSLNQGRIQTLHADTYEVHGPLLLPQQKAQQYDFPLPPESYADGKLALRFRKVGGPQRTAVVSEIWIIKGEVGNNGPATSRQLGYLNVLGVEVPTGLTKRRASRLIDEAVAKESV